MLSDRRQRVLAALIEEYVARALPVGSRTLTENYQLGVSSATVRNELSVLEEGGYIVSPHTSSGRIPTDIGYRSFVDDMLKDGLAEDIPGAPELVDQIRRNASEVDDLLQQTSLALSRLTDCLSIVIAPSVLKMNIKQVSLVSMNPHRILLIIVTEDGRVLNRQMDFYEEVDSEDLARAQIKVNAIFAGKSLGDVNSDAAQSIQLAYREPLVAAVMDEIIVCMREKESGRAKKLGMGSLLSKPEFSQSVALLPVVRSLEDDTVLLQLFDETEGARGAVPSIKIGSENAAESLQGVSVVASRYGSDGNEGVVAVVGPTRMNYSKVINAVRAASSALDDL